MKENVKIIVALVAGIIISSTISITATTLLQASSVSYKTSNGETVDVNSALDRLFDAADINGRLGNSDISSIGDGTVTGAINGLNSNLANGVLSYNPETDYFGMNYEGEWHDILVAGLQTHYLYKNGQFLNEATGYEANATSLWNDCNYSVKPNVNNTSDGLYISFTGKAENGSHLNCGSVYINPEIEFSKLSKYSKIGFKIGSADGSTVWMHATLRPNKSTASGYSSLVSVASSNSVVYLPININYPYIAINLRTYGKNSGYINIKEIWFE